MKQEVVPVDQQLNIILQQQIAKNHTFMASLFKTVLFCRHNNIAFRGSRDEDPSNGSLKENFLALLYFRVESGDTVLQEHFKTASRNATYVSKTNQKEMITTAGKYIKDQLSAEIPATKYFSVIADEATDVSNKENLSLVIRFVDSMQTIREEFVGFHLCEEGTSGRAMKTVITNAVADLGLNMNDCRGQYYNGAGNMAGRLIEDSALEDISLNRDENGDRGRGDWNVDSRNDAQSLLNAITVTFIVAIVVVRHILDLNRPLTLKLQRKEIDFLKAKDEIALLKHALAQMQNTASVWVLSNFTAVFRLCEILYRLFCKNSLILHSV